MKKIDQDGEWEVYSGVRILVKPSLAFEAKREQDRIAAEIAQAERDAVQAKRDACIAHLEKLPDLRPEVLDKIIQGLTKAKFSELELEMSFEDIITMVRNNRAAAALEAANPRGL